MANRIESALLAAIAKAEAGAPPRLAGALRHAVFPGGARVRPRLCLAVAGACGDDQPALSDAAAASLELLHCASLVHDDLPCFDDATLRRGRPSVHKAFGEPLAVLAGDALIVLAFETLARAGSGSPQRLVQLLLAIGKAAGAPHGLVAGQAWESEPSIVLEAYHQAKTGSLFTAATMCGALAAGADPAPWRAMGAKLGEAYQVADDLLDAVGDSHDSGKPVLRDAALSRPSAVALFGVQGAVARLRGLVGEAMDSVPDCPGREPLQLLTMQMADRLVPEGLKQTAA
jgi:geranylgeranyl diphosphate synthase type II